MNIHLFSEVLFCVWVIALIVILFIVVKYYRRVHYRLNSLSETIKRTQGGVNKRISENRELLELIKNQHLDRIIVVYGKSVQSRAVVLVCRNIMKKSRVGQQCYVISIDRLLLYHCV